MARKILLADDSVTAQNMGRRILTDAGYDVTTVNNGSAALKKIAESKPDLIILDVYMPGYGGLELCQRLREAPETARIPVLLTVGKLEPFKADEARRVRADAFIVKPFEASELLTALAKLEDKIVPQGQPPKVSRFARAMAAADESAKEFGDSETGWKNRLSIPPPHSKSRDAEPEEPASSASNGGDANQKRENTPSEMKSGLEEALLSSLPNDITPEEIAAIKAAAAAFSLPIDEIAKPEKIEAQPEISSEPVGKAQELSSESIPSSDKEAAAATFASAQEPQAELSPENTAPEVVTEPAVSAQASETEPPPPVISNFPAEANQNVGDEEVTAALASLAPSNGHGEVSRESATHDATRELVPVSMAAGYAAEAEISGPRWIAEPAGLSPDESSLALEQEMERAFAAFAAADAARLSFTAAPSPQAEERFPEVVASPQESFTQAGNSEAVGQESSPQASSAGSEQSVSQEAEHQIEVASSTVDAVSESVVVSEIKEETAFAAAAAAGSATIESTTPIEAVAQPVPQVESSESTQAVGPPERQGESDLAAAWANWKHIRETVLGSQETAPVAETVAETTELKTESSATDSTPQSAEHSNQEDSEEISDIVDSVLAEMKPRLMKEIARKMGKEPRKK